MAKFPENPEERNNFVSKMKKFKDWFELDVTIKIFGVTILHWHYPPNEEIPSVE